MSHLSLTDRDQSLPELVEAGEARVDGDRAALDQLLRNLDEFTFGFAIVTP